MKNLLLIDSTVTDYRTFLNSVNADTIPFVYRSSTTQPYMELPYISNSLLSEVPSESVQEPTLCDELFTRKALLKSIHEDVTDENNPFPSSDIEPYIPEPVIESTEPYVHEEATTRQSLLDFLGDTTIDRIGIVFTMNANVFLEGETFFQENNLQFVLSLLQTYQVKNIDYFACNTLQYPEWNEYYAKISETGVIVGASNNKTGNLQYGGDWTMESTNQDVEFIYFTNTIEYYKYLLDTSDTGFSTVVLKNDLYLWGSGSNAKNQLGNLGSSTNTASYSDFRKLTNVWPSFRIACSVNFTLIASDQTPGSGSQSWTYGSGSNADGQMPGFSGIQFAYFNAGSSGGINMFNAGEFFAIYSTGGLGGVAWGAGTPSYAYGGRTSPAISLSNVRWIACGKAHSLITNSTNGYIYASGLNDNYQLGTGNTTTVSTYTVVSTNNNVMVACGSSHSLALRDDGTIWGTGLNSSNQLGSLYGSNTTFVQISPPNKLFIAISAGATHSLAINMDGTIWGTGSNAYNQLGTMYGSNTTFAQLTPAGTAFYQVACGSYGSYHSLGLDSNGNLWGTGLNTSGQLGAAYGTNTTFVQIFANVTVIANSFPNYLDPFYLSYLFTLSSNTGVVAGNSLTLYGTNLASVSYVTYGGVNVSSFISKTQFKIVFTVPSTIANPKYVTINVSGTNYPSTNSSVNTVADLPATITSITQAASGLVTINGTNFVSPTVTMTGYTSGTVTKVSSSQLTFTPNSFIGSSTFTVTDSGNTVSYTASFPTITSISQAANGLVTINGTNFINPTVTIPGYTTGTVTKVSSSQLTFTPNTLVTSATFTVSDSGNSVSYTIAFITVTKMVQLSSGLITVTGTNFTNPNPTITISGGYTSGTVTKVSSTQLTFTPSGLIGVATFSVTDTNTVATYTSAFPTMTSFTPSSGNNNTTVILTGTNIGNVTSVLFGSVAGTNLIVTSTTVTVNAPLNTGNVLLTLTDSNGNSVVTTTPFKYSTHSSLFTTSLSDTANKLLTQLTLTNGIDTTGTLSFGSLLTNTALGPTNGSTVASSNNSSALATTAFVKAQGYSSSSYAGYAQMAVAQTFSALQTFSSGIQSSAYDAITPTSTVSVGSNLTTGTLNLATSTATINLNAPLSPTYTTAPTSTQIGYNVTLAPLNTANYAFSGANKVFRYVSVVPGATYIASAAVKPAISLDFFILYFGALKVTPSVGLDVTNYGANQLQFYGSSLACTTTGTSNIVLGGSVWSVSASVYIPPGFISLALVTYTAKAGNPSSYIETSMSVTRIA